MGLYSGGLIIGRIFVSEIWGAYFREGLFLGGAGGAGGGLIIGILRYIIDARKLSPEIVTSHTYKGDFPMNENRST